MSIFGFDLGFGNIKLFGKHGGIILPSHVASAGGAVVADLAGMKSEDAPLSVSIDGRFYYIGPRAHAWGRPVENLAYDRLTGSPEIRALMAGAFTEYAREHGAIDTPVTLYVGMPLEPLSGDRETVTATVKAIKRWMIGVHTWCADGQQYALNVADVKITSQPSGAFFDYLLTNDGNFHPDRAGFVKKEVGIISVGFNTVERLVVVSGTPQQRFTAGSTAGVRRLLELLNSDGLYSLGELDTLLRANAHDEATLRTSLEVWSREVNGEIERTWGKSWKRFSKIIVVGGGAVLLNGHLLPKFQGMAHMPDEPVISIARGLYKLARMKERH